MFWGKGPNWVFGVWDLIGVLRGAFRILWGAQGDIKANLKLPRGMSATTLPGGKFPYGICQNRGKGGIRGCLPVGVKVVRGIYRSSMSSFLMDAGIR